MGSINLYDNFSDLEKSLDENEIGYGEAMLEAIDRGDRKTIDFLFEKKVGIYDREIVDLILKQNSNVLIKLVDGNVRNIYEQIAIYAVKEDNEQIVELMFYKGANNYNEIMRSAIKEGKIEIVKLMMKSGRYNYSEIMRSAIKEGKIEILKLMMKRGGCKPNILIREAAREGKIEIVKLMLDKGANDYNSVMYFAACYGHIEIVRLMLDRTDNYSFAIEQAAIKGHIEIVKIAIEKGAEYKRGTLLEEEKLFEESIQKTMLSTFWEEINREHLSENFKEEVEKIKSDMKYPTSGYGYEQEFLLSSSLKKRKKDEENLFVSYGRFPNEMVVEIFKHLNIRSRIELIFLYSNRDLSEKELKEIEENEWNEYVPINVKDENGLTMLHKLCYYGHRNKVEFLVNKGALQNMEDKEGKTPLWYAKQGAKDGGYIGNKKFVEWISKLKGQNFG